MVRVKKGEMGDKIREKLNKEQLDGVVGGGGEYDPQSWQRAGSTASSNATSVIMNSNTGGRE